MPQHNCDIKKMQNVKLTPKTNCRKEVAEVCGPEACPIVKGDMVCKSEIKNVSSICTMYCMLQALRIIDGIKV